MSKPSETSKKTYRTPALRLAFCGVAISLAIISSEFLPSFSLPFGGSITLFSMLFVSLIGHWYGVKFGILGALAYGLLQFILHPMFYTIPQFLVDYLLAFGSLGLSGLFSGKKHGLIAGYITGVIGRYIFAVLSGVLFFASYAPEGTPALVYSLSYNATYIFPEMIVTLILLGLPPVNNALESIKKLA